MKVINLLAGPGTGKSTTAAALFAELKYAGIKAELVQEVAKDLCYEGSPRMLNQRFIMEQQFDRLKRLQGQVDVVVTDGPIILGTIYTDPADEVLRRQVRELHDRFDNVHVFLERVKPYQAYGRTQTEDEARALDAKIFEELDVEWDLVLPADRRAPAKLATKCMGSWL